MSRIYLGVGPHIVAINDSYHGNVFLMRETIRELMMHADYAFTKNEFDEWHFIKFRYAPLRDISYFTIDHLLSELGLYVKGNLNDLRRINKANEKTLEIWSHHRALQCVGDLC
ncbi:Hypothetical protein KNT65_gp291 [Escherichia phage EcS1]|uniref:Uncharacterized protein n=1 Tax=Escherichia phage EcS1 TaxID=2083276 RepID=A0A2Z5ZCS3_9CAUD|nr:Hypothetical protein KNT65_gp291 [Escherichia phage EcS1]BBC78202.1 Hypothetical protein [Escherichia phage EcS1]